MQAKCPEIKTMDTERKLVTEQKKRLSTMVDGNTQGDQEVTRGQLLVILDESSDSIPSIEGLIL